MNQLSQVTTHSTPHHGPYDNSPNICSLPQELLQHIFYQASSRGPTSHFLRRPLPTVKMCSQVCRIFGRASRPVLFDQVEILPSKLDHFESISRTPYLSICVRELKISGPEPRASWHSLLLVKQISPLLSSFTGLQVFVFQGQDPNQPVHPTDLDMLRHLLISLESLRTAIPLTTIRLEWCHLGPSTLAHLLAFPVSVVLLCSKLEGEDPEGQNLLSSISQSASPQSKAHSLSLEDNGTMLTKHIISGAIDLSSLTSIRCAGHISIQESLRVLETLHKHAPQIANLHFRMPVNYIVHSVDDVPIEIRKYYSVFKIPQWTALRRLSLGIWTLGITRQPTPLEVITRMVVFARRFLTSSLSNPSLFQCLELEIHDEYLEPIPPPEGWSDMSLWFALDDALVHAPQALLVIQFVGRYSQARKSAENLTELCENGLPKLVERKQLLICEEIGSRNYWDDVDMTA